MRDGTVPPVAIGLAAGLATAAIAVALTATGLLPLWLSTPLLFLAPGLAAGLAAPVRPTTGALLGAVTGLVASLLQAAVMLAQWTPVPNQYVTPPPLLVIALALVILYVPVYTVAGAAGAVLRPRLLAARGRAAPARRGSPEQRQWAGIAAGALLIAIPLVLEVIVAPRLGIWIQGDTLNALFLVSGLVGGLAAGVLSPGGARAGAGSGLLSAVFGLGAIAMYFIAQASASPAAGDGVPEGLWPIAIMILGFWVLPSAVLGGALGGSLRRPSGPPRASADAEL